MKNILTLLFSLFCLAAFAQGGESLGWWEYPVAYHITWGNIAFGFMGVAVAITWIWDGISDASVQAKKGRVGFWKWIKTDTSEFVKRIFTGVAGCLVPAEIVSYAFPDFQGTIGSIAMSVAAGFIGAYIIPGKKI